MKSDWFVTPAALSRARLDQLLGQEQLADKSGVSLRSIQGYERNEQRVRLETLRCLAKALARRGSRHRRAPREREGLEAKAPHAPTRSTAANAAATTSALPPRTQLETLVDLEREAGESCRPR